MTEPTNHTASEAACRRGPLLWIAHALLLAAAGLAVYLGVTSLRRGHVTGCEEGAGCDVVLSSLWSQVFGVPVALLGAALYLAYLALDFSSRWPAIRSALALAIVGAALWFVALQIFVVKAFCPWCCSTHGAATLGVILTEIARGRWARRSFGGVMPALAGVGAVLVLALAQAFGPKPATTASGSLAGGAKVSAQAARRFIELHDGKFRVEATALPSIGPVASAEHVVVGLFDYTCPHCRRLHGMLHEVRKSFGDKLAVVQMPGSTSQKASAIQRLMLVAWKVAPDQFNQVAELIHGEQLPPDEPQVRNALAALIGEERLQAALTQHTPWADSQLALTENIRQANKAIINTTRFPQLIVGKHIEAGERENVGAYYQLLAERLNLKREQVPRFAVVPASLSMGKIAAGSQHALRFDLANAGSVPVTIDRVQLPQGMRFAKTEPQRLVLAPKQTHAMEIAAEAPPVPGPASCEIIVYSDSETPTVNVPITAEVWNPIRMEPKFVDFADLRANPAPVKVTIGLEGPARLAQPTSNVSEFSATLEPTGSPAAFEVTVRASPNLSQVGYRRALITIGLTPRDSSVNWPKQIVIPVRGHVLPPK